MSEEDSIYENMKTWKPRPNWRKMRVDGDFLLLSDASLAIHYLNATAREIVEMLGSSKTIEDICASLFAMYDAPENVIRRDVIDTLRSLQWKHLIRMSR